MSTELKDRLTRIIGMCEGNSGVCNDIRFEASMALQAVESQAVAVIAPAIEWGEWREIENDFYKPSNKGYTLVRRFASDVIRVHLMGRNSIDGSEEELMAACQAHLQAQVNTALEGCNAVPYRDPQPLLDTLKFALPFIRAISSTMGDRNQLAKPSWYDVDESVSSMIQTWEEAGLHKD